jgi:hypothetical protein
MCVRTLAMGSLHGHSQCREVDSFLAMHYPYGGNCPFLNLWTVKGSVDTCRVMFTYLN